MVTQLIVSVFFNRINDLTILGQDLEKIIVALMQWFSMAVLWHIVYYKRSTCIPHQPEIHLHDITGADCFHFSFQAPLNCDFMEFWF